MKSTIPNVPPYLDAYSTFVSNEYLRKITVMSESLHKQIAPFQDSLSATARLQEHFKELRGLFKGIPSKSRMDSEFTGLNALRDTWEQHKELSQLFASTDTVRAQLEMLRALITVRTPEFEVEVQQNTGLLSALRVLDEIGDLGQFGDIHTQVDERTASAEDAAAGYETAEPVQIQAEDNGDGQANYLAAAVAYRTANNDDLYAVLQQILDAIKSSPESTRGKLVWLVLVPFLFNVMTWIAGPVADFHIKKRLDEPRPGVAAEVRKAAEIAVGNVGLL